MGYMRVLVTGAAGYIAKFERAGFKPEVSLQAGIAGLIKGYQIVRRNQFANV